MTVDQLLAQAQGINPEVGCIHMSSRSMPMETSSQGTRQTFPGTYLAARHPKSCYQKFSVSHERRQRNAFERSNHVGQHNLQDGTL